MAGHSKWANIRFRKAGQDAKRGKLFTKLIRAIVQAVKEGGGGEVENNPGLRNAIDKALSGNMTRDVIDRAIKKAAGGDDGKIMERINYEGYGPDGVAVLVDCMTDNKNRTVAEVRHAFSKHGGNLGTSGSVAYLFSNVGHILVGANANEEELFEIAVESGAEDVELQDDNTFFIQVESKSLYLAKAAIIKAGMEVLSAENHMVASTSTELNFDDSEKVMRLIDRLEDLDDVQDVYTNADFDDVFLASMG
ncbi:MAG: YebC/PmpR family DNA-binding transcriptional regulator [Francisellaceae bacterium]|mgnify:FL=1|jgi:YebC/PmpR family DNA-binding regulatory protein|nr:YebC/PmpR family DNA-binding transcriptional regulator [Francisellaceae bacterium]MBT6206733.1 YebC/PmpR family DNA-binding transcriptional regulator [Francisellaceae bacterium]MBT6538091.1 YebC/PmpR family DNA-binding transcriptional regulator [Francisellaceae bacterium]